VLNRAVPGLPGVSWGGIQNSKIKLSKGLIWRFFRFAVIGVFLATLRITMVIGKRYLTITKL
jgi:hypothetical protein